MRHECSIDPLCYGTGYREVRSLKEQLKAAPPVSGAQNSEFIEDIAVLLPVEQAFDTAAVAKIVAKIEDMWAVCCRVQERQLH